MIVLIKLILAHLIGDFILQPHSWVEKKENRKLLSVQLYVHALIHGALVLLLFWSLDYWLLAILITIIHMGVDTLKLYFQKDGNKTRWFLIDQLLHIVSIFVLWYLFFNPALGVVSIWENPYFWIYLTAVLFLTLVCGILIQVLLSNWAKSIGTEREKSSPNAAKYIGILERLLVFIFVVTGHWEAIGFLVAAKSVFRFGNLKDSRDRKLTEYILIGTLLSFGIAVIVGILVVALTNSFINI